MHILFITYYYEPDLGAASVRLTRLAKLLHQRNHQITVLTSMPHYPQGRIHDRYRGKLFTDENCEGIRVVQVWLWATPRRQLVLRLISQLSFMVMCILRGLFLPRPDVIFVENQPIFAGLAGWFLSRIKRRPYLMNVSDFWPEYLLSVGVLSEKHLLYQLFKALVNRTQRDANAIVALLPGLLESVERRIGTVRHGQVIMNAVDLQRFKPSLDTHAFREKYGLGNAKLITFVGTLGYHLDLDTMMETAAAFEQRDDIYFVFVGTGIYRDKMSEKVHGLTRTKWLGLLKHEEMPQVWAASYLGYWAELDTETIRKAFHAKLFEAMSSGVPCVIALEGLVSDILKQSYTGISIPFGDTQGCIDTIQYLLEHEDERDKMSQNARAYAEAHFDPQAVADAYEATLRKIAKP